jgi:glycosyltransferase involved in cell wall biosynthesis
MKICRIVYDWPEPWSGLAPHPYEVTVAQAKQGHQIELFCAYWPKAGKIVKPKNTTIHPILREPIPNSIFFVSSVILFFKYILWRKNNTCDIIHSHGHFGIWIYAYRAFLKKHLPWAKELKIPLVVHFHNTAMGRWATFIEKNKEIKEGSKKVGWPMAVYSDKNAVKAAAACIFVSEDNRQEAIKYYGANPSRCFVIETGVNTELFRPVTSEERAKSRHDLNLDEDDKIILNHGVLNERKNIHLLLEAAAYFPPHYKLMLSGSGDGAYMGKLNEIIRDKGLEPKIIQTGYTPYPHVPITYQVSDLFVLPSAWEGVPKAAMQGLACGVPCLVSGFKLSEDIEGLFYLDSMEPVDIAKKIIELIENPSRVDVNKIVNLYAWDRRAREIDKIYEFAAKNYI